MQKALGLIETIGLVAAIEAADAAVKAANVVLVGYENTKGGGKITIKLLGDVGAVKAAVSAGVAAASRVGKVYGCSVIPRPHDEIAALIRRAERGPVDRGQVKEQPATPAPAASPVAPPAVPAPEVPPPPETELPPVKPLAELPTGLVEAARVETVAPGAEKVADVPAPRCAAITKSGERCSLPARAGSLYCNVHRKLDQAVG